MILFVLMDKIIKLLSFILGAKQFKYFEQRTYSRYKIVHIGNTTWVLFLKTIIIYA